MDTAVVTGAGRGIGRAIARRLANRGYAVLVTDVNANAASDRGPLRVWVNNAGVLRTQKAWQHSDDEVRMLVEANVLGVMWGSRAAVEAMRSGGGDIINLASMSSFGPVPGLAVYGATKHAVLGFTTSLQGDLDEAGIEIRTHAVCPDTVDTGMVRERRDDEDAALVFSAPRMLRPDEVADHAVAMIGERRPVVAIPRSRAVLVRTLALFPRAGLRLLPLFRRIGEKKRLEAR
jgi:short-subunit dehydrogenase